MTETPPVLSQSGASQSETRPTAARSRLIRFLLPSAVSARHAVMILVVGFAVEAATEVYQFLARGNLVQGPLVYYTTLGTTLLGFYLMFLGLREWHFFHPKPVRTPTATGTRRWPWLGLGLWTAGTAATAGLSLALGGAGSTSTPVWVSWPVGGIVVLAFGDFFLGLRREARTSGNSWAEGLGWAAAVWALGVATVAGLVVGDRALLLLTEFVTNWSALIESIGSIVVAMSPLFIAYGLMIGAFSPALLVRGHRAGQR
jgi:hypothetical protein